MPGALEADLEETIVEIGISIGPWGGAVGYALPTHESGEEFGRASRNINGVIYCGEPFASRGGSGKTKEHANAIG
ncbi:MAG TPA: hypothetical protein DDX19_21495 [Rhodopirellula baltica]|nr:hypothetical protein [Rhodopirellula baltica]